MNILIIKKSKKYQVLVSNDDLTNEDLVDVVKLYPINFLIDQNILSIFLQDFCKLKNGFIEDCNISSAIKLLEDFINIQNSIFLLNQRDISYKLNEIMKYLSSSQSILTGPENLFKSKLYNFLDKNIDFVKNKKIFLTSKEIKTRFFLETGINMNWNDITFKNINNTTNTLLNQWALEHKIESSLIKTDRYPVKNFFGITFKIEK